MAATVLAIVWMWFVPPWREYRVTLRDPLEPLVEYREFAGYAWHDTPPVSQGKGQGYTVNNRLLAIQILLTAGLGTAIAFGGRGLFVYGLAVGGALSGGCFILLNMPAQKPHAGWVSPVWFLILGVFTLVGLVLGLAVGITAVHAWPEIVANPRSERLSNARK